MDRQEAAFCMGPPKMPCPGRISAETEDLGNPGSGQNGVSGGQHRRVVPTPGPHIDLGEPHDQSPTQGPLLGHKYGANQAEIREIRRRGQRARRPGGRPGLSAGKSGTTGWTGQP